MKFISTLAFSALCSVVLANGWNETSTETWWITKTDYTTYCPESTTITITTCEDHKCAPHVITVTEATTVTVTGECVVPTEPPIVTDYVTVCPETTTFTITVCEDKKCGESTVTVLEPGTITVTGECIPPTEEPEKPSKTTTTAKVTTLEYVTYCPEPTTLTLTTCVETVCGEHTVEVSSPGSVTVTYPVVIPTTEETVAEESTTPSTVAGESTPAPSAPSATFEAGASKKAAGILAAAGLGLMLL